MNGLPRPWGLRILRGLPLPRKLGVLDRLDGKRLASSGVAWISVSNGVRWKLDLTDPTQRWIVFGDYEGSVQMRWIRAWLAGGGTVMDSGANIGQMCLYVAPLAGVRVEAFEPFQEAREWLCECLRSYPDWRVRVHDFGLSSHPSSIVVQVDGARTTARMDWYAQNNLPQATINVEPLDSVASRHGFGGIRLWKLDVEGHELNALQGAKSLLRHKSIAALIVEISTDAVVRCLADMGYRAHVFNSHGILEPVDGEGVRGNVIALPDP